ncbi:hypothetical protein K1T71_000616 [Dendrolimus kikuchii]|uniref:Uncharacterized protein n=1 Tax=Dendrolimus kikuchii TaxID=765133 RepID=A0ACC1DJQ8_9NEOP|nr:hypothetical protein K1T71_000616 [Dendrolimus kikuchii]
MDRINALENEIEDLRKVLKDKEDELYKLKNEWVINKHQNGPEQNCNINVHSKVQYGDLLPKWAIERYSRQILLPEIGVQGQKRICEAKVLIVGAGGLGCPAALYLAGAGVGEIGIVDYDSVDITNIHRQVLHGERDEHMSKAESAARTLRSINSHIKIQTYNLQLSPSNAMAIAKRYDLILDCTDNVPTRYLLNDLCVLSKLPLISGSALKMEGQLTIYGYRANGNTSNKMDSYAGPCYRCLFPTPPPPEAVGSCSANGVAGPIPGVIGVLQALEAIKYIVGYNQTQLLVERLLLFDGDYLTFRNVQLRPRNPQCAACSDNPTIIQLKDYEVMCKMQAKEKDLELHILPAENRITPSQLAEDMNNAKEVLQRHLLVDVRSEAEFQMCRIDGSVNYPIEKLRGEKLDQLLEEIKKCLTFICRRGNDSQVAAKTVLDAIDSENGGRIKDLTGGLHAWSKDVDNNFPVY